MGRRDEPGEAGQRPLTPRELALELGWRERDRDDARPDTTQPERH